MFERIQFKALWNQMLLKWMWFQSYHQSFTRSSHGITIHGFSAWLWSVWLQSFIQTCTETWHRIKTLAKSAFALPHCQNLIRAHFFGLILECLFDSIKQLLRERQPRLRQDDLVLLRLQRERRLQAERVWGQRRTNIYPDITYMIIPVLMHIPMKFYYHNICWKKNTGWFFLTGPPLNLLSVGR